MEADVALVQEFGWASQRLRQDGGLFGSHPPCTTSPSSQDRL